MNAFSRIILPASAALSLAACSAAPESTPLDGDWTLSSDESRLTFTTVKAGSIAEAHSFKDLSGTVSADGAATLSIGLASVATNIEVRDGRMRDMLFEVATYPAATVTAQLDPATFEPLAIGDSVTQSVDATLDLHGVQAPVTADLAVTRIGEDKVKVETTTPIILDASTFNLADGVEQLREVAGLDSIAPSVPVSFSITYTR